MAKLRYTDEFKTTRCVCTFTFSICHPHIHRIIRNNNPHKHTHIPTHTHTFTRKDSYNIPTVFWLYFFVFFLNFDSFHFVTAWWLLFRKNLRETQGSPPLLHTIIISITTVIHIHIQYRRLLLFQIRTSLLISGFGPWRHEERETILKSLC